MARLRWFSRDILKAAIENDMLVLSDLRMGYEPQYVFNHVVAERSNPHWTSIPTRLLPMTISDRALVETWHRIWADTGGIDRS